MGDGTIIGGKGDEKGSIVKPSPKGTGSPLKNLEQYEVASFPYLGDYELVYPGTVKFLNLNPL